MREFYVCTNDEVNLFCRTIGEGEPLLMIHGAMVDSDFFLDCASELSKSYMVILYDRRGYSRSSSAKDYSIARQANDAVCVLNFLGVEKVNIVSCSAGGYVALKISEENASLVSKLLMYETPLFATKKEKSASGIIRSIIHDTSVGKLSRAKCNFLLLSEKQDLNARNMPHEMLQNNWNNGDVFLMHEFEQYCLLTIEDLRPLKTDNATVYMMGIGKESDNSYYRRSAKFLANLIDCPIYEFLGGHNSAYDHPKEFADATISIFNSIN